MLLLTPEPLYKAVGVEKLQGVVQSCDRSTGEGREWSTQMWRNTATWSGPAGREPWVAEDTVRVQGQERQDLTLLSRGDRDLGFAFQTHPGIKVIKSEIFPSMRTEA